MPITSMRIRGFKCFADSGHVPIAPFTVVLGRNSSGKSSLIQPWLLLKQTMEARGFANTINLKGALYDAGSYREIVHNHDVEQKMVLEFSVRFDKDIDFRVLPENLFLPGLQYGLGRAGEIAAVVQLILSQVTPFATQLMEVRVCTEDEPDLVVRSGPGGEAGEAKWKVESPETLRLTAMGGPGPFATSVFPVLFAPRETGKRKPEEFLSPFAKPALKYNAVLGSLEMFVRTMRAMGPFRTPPERRYEFSGKDFPDVGLSGKSTIDALIADRLTGKSRTLGEVAKWFLEAGLADGVELVPIEEEQGSYQVRFRVGQTAANYADVGFGFSQVLPVLVQGLRTPKRAVFVCQQPELHLHPDAQVALADFFTALVCGKRWVFVETHSEHFVLGLRRILASEKDKAKPRLTPKDVSLLYVDDTTPGNCQVQQLSLDENMSITNWPKGFMDQATQERLRIMEATCGKVGNSKR